MVQCGTCRLSWLLSPFERTVHILLGLGLGLSFYLEGCVMLYSSCKPRSSTDNFKLFTRWQQCWSSATQSDCRSLAELPTQTAMQSWWSRHCTPFILGLAHRTTMWPHARPTRETHWWDLQTISGMASLKIINKIR